MEQMQIVELRINGMTCDSCRTHVEHALQSVAGVETVEVPGWKSGRATITAAPEVTAEDLTRSVRDAGYRADELSRRSAAPKEPAKDGGRDVDYDLVVIGTGSGGMAAAIKAAEMDRKVCIIESGVIGGTCVNIGCVPSKALIRAAEAYHRAGHHPFAGLSIPEATVNWKEVVSQKDELVGELRQKKYVDVLESYGESITLVEGRAQFHPDGTISLDDGQVFRPGKIVIATGTAPKVLPLPGIEGVEVLTSTTVMELERQPASMIVIGGRVIGLEIGQAMARFGTKVTVVQRSDRIIPEHEPEISGALADYLREEGLVILTGVKLDAIRQEGEEKILTATVNGKQEEYRAEAVLMAVGRVPNTEGMGLEEAGITLDRDGFIVVDEHMRTTNPKVFAAGDVTTLPKFVYVAAAGGGVAAENALDGNAKVLDLTVLPEVIFTDPQVARVGLTEAEAIAAGHEVRIANLPLAHVPRALAARDTRGLIKLVADKDSDRLLGAHVLAAEGGEIIQTAALAVKFGIAHGFTVTELRQMLFPYLVQTEGLKLAAQTFDKDLSQLSCCAG